MPKVSVCLPDDLYRAARDNNLPISGLAQRAIEVELSVRASDAWVDGVRNRAPRYGRVIDSAALLADVRDELGG